MYVCVLLSFLFLTVTPRPAINTDKTIFARFFFGRGRFVSLETGIPKPVSLGDVEQRAQQRISFIILQLHWCERAVTWSETGGCVGSLLQNNQQRLEIDRPGWWWWWSECLRDVGQGPLAAGRPQPLSFPPGLQCVLGKRGQGVRGGGRETETSGVRPLVSRCSPLWQMVAVHPRLQATTTNSWLRLRGVCVCV